MHNFFLNAPRVNIDNWLSLQQSTDNGNSFTELFTFEVQEIRNEFTMSKVSADTFYFAGATRPCRIRKNGAVWGAGCGFSPRNGTDQSVHDDVRDIDVVDNGNGTETIYWSTDGTLNKQTGANFENLTKQNINLWMVVGFAEIDATNEILGGVFHGGSNYRSKSKEWSVYEGGDGGFATASHSDWNKIVTTTNAHIRRVDRANLNTSGTVGVPDNLPWHNYVIVPTKPAYSWSGSNFFMGYNDIYRYNWDLDSALNVTNNNKKVTCLEATPHHPSVLAYSTEGSKFQENGSIIISYDGGLSWDSIQGDTNADVSVGAIFFHPDDQDEIWVGMVRKPKESILHNRWRSELE